jgi:hypothetical protein
VRRGASVLLAALVLGLVAGCFAWRSPSGGSQATFSGPRPIHPSDIALPDSFRIEAVATGLTFPTFDDNGHIYVSEAGYSYGEVWTTPRLLRPDAASGKTTVVAYIKALRHHG